MKNTINAAYLSVLWALCAIAVVTPALAMEAPAPASEEQIIDEVTVVGQRSLLNLRLEVSEAEDAMYGLYNEFNTDDKYDMVCKTDERIFSHIREKACRPRYIWNAMREEAQDRFLGVEEALPVAVVIATEYPALNAKFQEMLARHPELYSAYAKLYELKNEYSARRTEQFESDE